MHSFPKYFNMMIQAWNTIFFGLVSLGGIYLITLQSYLIGIVLTVIGVAGAWYCLTQAQKWNDVKDEDLPHYKSLKEAFRASKKQLKQVDDSSPKTK